ncbi:MAG: LAGLIDADG family homing endonuclease [archaeon]
MDENISNDNLISRIRDIRKSGNFRHVINDVGKERLKEFINSIYPKFSITEIEKITGIPDSTLEYWFKQLDIPFIRNHIDNFSIAGEINSEIIIKKGNKTKKVSSIKITPELAYLIGFTLGDGTVQKYMVEVFNKDKRLKEVLFNIIKQYGSIIEEERKNGLWRLRLSSVKLANLIKIDKKIRKDTIDYIFRKDELANRFIAAFWDAEGTVIKRKNTTKYFDIILSNSNEYILLKIVSYLKLKKISLSVRQNIDLRKNSIIKGKKKIFVVRIFKDSFQKWINLIGLNMYHSKKREIVKDIEIFYGGNQNE